MMAISVIGLIINIVVAWILHSQGSTKENLNVRSAFLHVIGDLLGSVGAIIAAILIMLFGWYIADPIASMIVSLLVLYSGWNVLKEAVNILMEAKPLDIDTERVIEVLKSIEGVTGVHDLHIWMISSDFLVMTVHLNVKPDIAHDLILANAKRLIYSEFGIRHATIQTEGSEQCREKESCN
jgi:cobalt-zinc-cadmium efflux system protein